MDKEFVIKVDGASYRSTKVSRTRGETDSLYHITEESPFFDFSDAIDIVVIHFPIPPHVLWKIDHTIGNIAIHWSSTTAFSATHLIENYGAGQIRVPLVANNNNNENRNRKDTVICSLSFEASASVKKFKKSIIPAWKSCLPDNVKNTSEKTMPSSVNDAGLDCFSETITRIPSKMEFVAIQDLVKEVIFSVNYFDFSRVLNESKKVVF